MCESIYSQDQKVSTKSTYKTYRVWRPAMRKRTTDLDRYMCMLIHCDRDEGLRITHIGAMINRPYPEAAKCVQNARQLGWITELGEERHKRYKTTDKGRTWCLQYIKVAQEALGTLRSPTHVRSYVLGWVSKQRSRLDLSALMVCVITTKGQMESRLLGRF